MNRRGRLRIAVVCPYDFGRDGGVQQITIEISRRLTATHEVTLIGPGEPKEDLGVKFVGVGSSVAVRGNNSTNELALHPKVRGRVRDAVADADLVHVHEPFLPQVSTVALGTDRPVVATFHADPARWGRVLYRMAAPLGRLKLKGAVITASSPVSASALPESWSEATIVPNGIDVAGYQVPAERDRRRVVFLGRDDPRKGLDVLLRAWPAVSVAEPEAELVVMGSARDQQLSGVTYLGRVTEAEKRAQLSAAAVYVAPNTGGESFGLVLAEAMAAGCAPVASDLPAFRWVAEETASYFPVGDSDALARGLIDTLADPEAATSQGLLAQQRVGRFDWSNVIEDYLACYRRALDK